LHNLRRLPNGKWTWKHDPKRHSPNFALERDTRAKQILEQIHRISCPTLVLRGARSDIFTNDNAQNFANALPKGRWSPVPNAGHTIQGDNPRGLLDALGPFLKEIGL